MALTQHAVSPARARLRRSILALMGVNRMTQTALGSKIGVDQGGISRRLKGELPFSEWELEKVAGVFGVEVEALYDPTTILSTSGYRSPSATRQRSDLTVLQGGGRGRRTGKTPLLLGH